MLKQILGEKRGGSFLLFFVTLAGFLATKPQKGSEKCQKRKREIANLEAKSHNLERTGVFAHELCNICRNGCINKELFLL